MLSDDFGLDEDDPDFLAAATQAEASQNADFEDSPRPTKRRRVSENSFESVGGDDGDLPWSAIDEEHRSPQDTRTGSAWTAFPTQTNATQVERSDEPEEYHYFPGEAGIEEVTKKSKYRIHVPENGGKFPDMIFTQTQHDLDNDMAKFRGAVWKRPPLQPAPNVSGIANPQGYGAGAIRPTNRGITNYFQAAGRLNVEEDDAALAARLQAEEDASSKQHKPGNVHQIRNGSQTWHITQQDLATQLADLPDDAFSSSSPEKSPAKDIVDLSSQFNDHGPARLQNQALRGPQTGLRQLDLFGHATQQDMTASQAAKKRHAWPLVSKDEPPTHHKLDHEAMKSWIYPTNLGTIRDYQYNIVSRSLFHNTLVALPTGLGKTFIAATVMLNFYRWTKDAQLIFMAPTKPLIAQQMEACYGVVGIPRRDTVLMTGETTPANRAEEWSTKRVFFMTPQTVINDLKTGIADPKKIVLIIVDEAHKSTGGYAYTEVVAFMRRFNSSFRVLALTATPGSSTESVQSVIDNLGIARVELRTESSIDIRQYTHEKQTETEVFEYSDDQTHIMELMTKALKPSVDKLASQNAYWSRDPMQLTAYGLTTSRAKWQQSEAGRRAPQPVKGMIQSIFTVLASLAHSIGLLKNHGIGPFYATVLSFKNTVDKGETKSKTALGIAQSEHFTKMLSTMRTWTNNPDFIGHPKLEYLRNVVLNHFLDAGEGRQGSDVPPSATRVMIFASYRDSTDEICRVLKRSEPMIRPHVFVGQAASRGQEGMDQKRQNAVIQDFKSGKFNTLIATSIGEEGLDIGTVDLIVNFDASASPIRMLQRIGRTGRKRMGRVVLLLMKGKEEKDYEKAQDNYLYIQKTIADEDKYAYRDDQSPRIIPKEIRPVADKRLVEIPIENSQPVDLNEKGKKGKGRVKKKAPPKKFHMPDGVRTTFTKASRLDAEGDAGSDKDEPVHKKAKVAAVKKNQAFVKPRDLPVVALEPEPASLPYLADVLLSDAQMVELQSKYAQAADDLGDLIMDAPEHARFPSKLRELGSTKHMRHGRTALNVQRAMQRAHAATDAECHSFDESLHLSDLEDAGPASVRLVSPESGSFSITAPQTSKKRPRRSKFAQPRAAAEKNPSPALQIVSDLESEEELRVQRATPPLNKKPRGRPKKKQPLHRAVSYGSAAGEGVESSPEPTPMDMRIGTQGVDIGSQDTSCEDDNEEPDTEDEAFIARSSDPIEMASSSQPGTPAGQARRGLKRKAVRRTSLERIMEIDDSDSDPVMNSEIEDAAVQEPATKGKRGRRVVHESDDDDD